MRRYIHLYLGLGTNLGDRLRNLYEALSRLDAALGLHYLALSSVIETDSWGFEGGKFLNCCVLYRIPYQEDPETQGLEILRQCKEIEKAMGRREHPLSDAEGHRIYIDRIIDIDILFLGTERINNERLTVPHPLISERDFVKVPLSEIAKPSLKRAFPDIFD